MADYVGSFTGAKIDELLSKTNNIYAVGDILTTSTNTSPSARFGGTWNLINKSFAETIGTLTSGTHYTDTTNGTSTIAWVRTSDTIRLRIYVKPAVEITDAEIEFCTIDFTKLGLSTSDYGYGIISFAAPCDGGQGIAMCSLSPTGTLSTVDRVTKTSSYNGNSTDTLNNANTYSNINIPATSDSTSVTITANLTINISYERKDDSACDKFYWKRTA